MRTPTVNVRDGSSFRSRLYRGRWKAESFMKVHRVSVVTHFVEAMQRGRKPRRKKGGETSLLRHLNIERSFRSKSSKCQLKHLRRVMNPYSQTRRIQFDHNFALGLHNFAIISYYEISRV